MEIPRQTTNKEEAKVKAKKKREKRRPRETNGKERKHAKVMRYQRTHNAHADTNPREAQNGGKKKDRKNNHRSYI